MLMRSPLARDRRSPPGFIRPRLAVELKHDGFRIVANKAGERVHLW